jgi:hypothetical protein
VMFDRPPEPLDEDVVLEEYRDGYSYINMLIPISSDPSASLSSPRVSRIG